MCKFINGYILSVVVIVLMLVLTNVYQQYQMRLSLKEFNKIYLENTLDILKTQGLMLDVLEDMNTDKKSVTKTKPRLTFPL